MNGPSIAPPSTASKAVAVQRSTSNVRALTPARVLVNPAPESEVNAFWRILMYLRFHWLMIVFCGSLLGTALAYAAWCLLPAKYESYALLQVASAPTSIAQQNDPNRSKTDFITYLKTTAQLIKSEFVLNSALSDPKYKISDLPTLQAQKEPIKYLDEKLQVVYSEGSEVIRVALEGHEPNDLRKIVDAVKDAYYREVVEKEIQQKANFRVKVEQARAALEGLMRTKVGKPDSPPHTVGLGGNPNAPALPLPPLPNTAGNSLPVTPAVPPVAAVPEPEEARKARFNVTLQRIFAMETQLQQFPVTIAEKAGEVESLRKQIEALRTGPASQESIDAAERDPEVMQLARIAKAYRDTANFQAKVVTNPNSERIIRAREQADAAETQWRQARDERARNLETARRQEEANKLFVLLEKAQRDLRNLQEREKTTRVQLETARRELAEIPPEPIKEEHKAPVVDPVVTDLLTHDDMYRRLTAQLISLGFELDSPPRVRKLQDASVPMQKDSKKQLLGTLFAGLMGFALIGLAVVGYESTVRRISSLSELTSSSPTGVVGVIPWQTGTSPMNDPLKRSEINEAIDKLRSYVAQTWLSKGATTVAVTSPIADEGKAFTAFALASSLAQAGYKTLLVDFDLRQPILHTFVNLMNHQGVCELLRGEAEIRQVIHELPSGLQLLPAGKWSDEARQAAVGGRLEILFNRLKDPYDCLIIHDHALLTVAEAVEIVRRADVVLLCSQYRETRLPLLLRAVDRVATMEVPYSGIVYVGATSSESLV